MTQHDPVCEMEIKPQNAFARLLLKGVMMKNPNESALTAVTTFLIGVIVLWSFGKEWLNFGAPWVFLVGLIGVAIPVLIFSVWKIHYRSDKDHK